MDRCTRSSPDRRRPADRRAQKTNDKTSAWACGGRCGGLTGPTSKTAWSSLMAEHDVAAVRRAGREIPSRASRLGGASHASLSRGSVPSGPLIAVSQSPARASASSNHVGAAPSRRRRSSATSERSLVDGEVVGRAALFVTSVGQELPLDLTAKEPDAVFEDSGRRHDGAGEHERSRVLQDVVAADVVLDRPPQVARLSRQVGGDPVREFLRPRQTGERRGPRHQSDGGRVRVPRRSPRSRLVREPVADDLRPEPVAGGGSLPGGVGSERREAVEVEEKEETVGGIRPELRRPEAARRSYRDECSRLVRSGRGARLGCGVDSESFRESGPLRRRREPSSPPRAAPAGTTGASAPRADAGSSCVQHRRRARSHPDCADSDGGRNASLERVARSECCPGRLDQTVVWDRWLSAVLEELEARSHDVGMSLVLSTGPDAPPADSGRIEANLPEVLDHGRATATKDLETLLRQLWATDGDIRNRARRSRPRSEASARSCRCSSDAGPSPRPAACTETRRVPTRREQRSTK